MKMQALRSIGSPPSQTTRKFTNEKFSGRGQILLVIQTYVRGSCHLKAFAQGVGNFEIDSSVGLQQLHLLLDSQLNVKQQMWTRFSMVSNLKSEKAEGALS